MGEAVEKVVDYFKIAKANQSALKYIKHNPQRTFNSIFGQKEFVKKAHFDLGHAVEALIVGGPTNLVRNFTVVLDEDIPSEKLLKITDAVIKEILAGAKESPIDLLFAEARDVGYQPRWKDDTLRKHLAEKCRNYYEAFTKNTKKTIISMSIRNQAFRIYENFLTSELYTSLGGYANIFKLVLQASILLPTNNTVDCKGELDNMHINEGTKTIDIIDYKVMADPVGFMQSFWKFGYYFQAGFYYLLTKSVYPEYSIRFKFIVLDSSEVVEPFSLEISEESLKVLSKGPNNIEELSKIIIHNRYSDVTDVDTVDYLSSKLYPVEALERYSVHLGKQEWEFPLEFVDNDSKHPNLILGQ